MTPTASSAGSPERRQYERIPLNYPAQIFVNENKRRIGLLRQLGQGGLLIETDQKFENGMQYELELIDDSEKIKFQVQVTCRSSKGAYSSFEFGDLSVDCAENIGILLGKYYPEQ